MKQWEEKDLKFINSDKYIFNVTLDNKPHGITNCIVSNEYQMRVIK